MQRVVPIPAKCELPHMLHFHWLKSLSLALTKYLAPPPQPPQLSPFYSFALPPKIENKNNNVNFTIITLHGMV